MSEDVRLGYLATMATQDGFVSMDAVRAYWPVPEPLDAETRGGYWPEGESAEVFDATVRAWRNGTSSPEPLDDGDHFVLLEDAAVMSVEGWHDEWPKGTHIARLAAPQPVQEEKS